MPLRVALLESGQFAVQLRGGRTVPKDLRSFVDELVERRPDELKMVTEEVDPRFGLTAVAAKFERLGQFPALYFQKVKGSDLPAAVNLTATYDRLAMALGTDVHGMVERYAER